MALLDQLLVRNKARNTSRIGNGQRPLVVVTLVLFFVSIVLATGTYFHNYLSCITADTLVLEILILLMKCSSILD